MAPLLPVEQGGFVVMVLVCVHNILTRVEMVSFLVICGQFSATNAARLRVPNWGQVNLFNLFFSAHIFMAEHMHKNMQTKVHLVPNEWAETVKPHSERTCLKDDQNERMCILTLHWQCLTVRMCPQLLGTFVPNWAHGHREALVTQ
jgi:hypothetical protein